MAKEPESAASEPETPETGSGWPGSLDDTPQGGKWDALEGALARFGDGDLVEAPEAGEHPEEPDGDAEEGADPEAEAAEAPQAEADEAGAEADEAGAEADEAGAEADEAGAEADEAEEGEAKGERQPERPKAPARRFELLGEDGNPLPEDAVGKLWPEGAKMRFKADGQDIEITSADAVVALAQQGVNYARKSSELGQREGRYQQALEAARTRLAEYDALLHQVATDEATFEQLKAVAQKASDPEFQKARQVETELAQVKGQQAEQQQAQRDAALNQFWQEVGTQARDLVAASDDLTDEDVPTITQHFWGLYAQAREQVLGPALEAASKRTDVSEEDAVRYAEAQAVRLLTTENLAEIARRVGEARGKQVGSLLERRKQKEAERAKQHNEATKKKLRHSAEARPLRGGGGSPPAAGGKGLVDEGASFDEKMEAAFAELRAVGS